jgi:hypothetical protein
MRLEWIVVLLGVWAVSILLSARILYCDVQWEFPNNQRKNASVCILFGMLMGCFGPLGVITAFLLTGFAQHGIWKIKPRKEGGEQ